MHSRIIEPERERPSSQDITETSDAAHVFGRAGEKSFVAGMPLPPEHKGFSDGSRRSLFSPPRIKSIPPPEAKGGSARERETAPKPCFYIDSVARQ